MRAARTFLFSGAFALQAFCSAVFAELPATDTREALFLRRITEYWKEGHYKDAKKQLLGYLSQYPSSVYLSEIHAMLGDLYLHEGSVEEALHSYEKIVSPHCKQLTSLHYAECLYQLGRYDALVSWIQSNPIETLQLQDEQQERMCLLVADSHYRIVQKEENPEIVQTHAKSALEYFSKISVLDRDWQLVVAYLYALTGEKKIAAERYLLLCQEFPEKKAELLFQAAFLINKEEPAKSISLLQEAVEITSPLQQEAAFNELTLLFREKKYVEFLKREEVLRSLIQGKEPALFAFYRGSAHFYLSQFDGAAIALQDFLSSDPSSKEELRFALQALIVCGYKQSNTSLLGETLQRWQKDLPLDEGYLDGLLALSELLLQNKQYEEAGQALNEFMSRFPSSTKQELALFDYGQVMLLQGNYAKGKESFEQYLERYPTSPRANTVWQNLIFATFEILKHTEKAERDALKAGLAVTLKKALGQKELFSNEIVRIYHLNLTQLLFELGDSEEILQLAGDYLKQYPDHESARGIRLMLIACHVTLGSPTDIIISTVQAALEKEADPQVQTKLHLQLYNAYLAQNDLDNSTEHLLAIYNSSFSSIKKENLLWLAQRMEQKQQFSLAQEIVEKAIGFVDGTLARDASFDPYLFEEEALHLKHLYLANGEVEKGIHLLSNLVDVQNADPAVSWRFARRIQFELGELYEMQGRNDEALTVYDRLIGDAAYSQASYFLRAALLQRAKLQFSKLHEEERKDGSQEILGVLGTLKDLQIAKNVESEPIHLEAALEYASIRCSLLPKDLQNQKMDFYLDRIQEDFVLATTDTATAYLKDRENWPEQNSVIENYLCYITAEKKRLKSMEAKRTGDVERFSTMESEARIELQILEEALKGTSSPLTKRVKESLALLGEIE